MNYEIYSVELYEKVTKLREEKKWSIYKLAKRANITENTIYYWRDNSESFPSIYTLTSICKALGVSLANLLYDESDKTILTKSQKDLLGMWALMSEQEKNICLNLIKHFVDKI